MNPQTSSTLFYKDLFFLTILIGIFYTLFLGHYPLLTPDEARYSEIAKEMLLSKDYITPHLNGLIYLEKPILFYWLQSFAFKLFGFSEWAARLTNTAMAVIGCLMTYWAGIRLFNRRVAWYSALVLATSLLYFVMSHAVTLDMMVSTCLALCFFSLLMQIQLGKATSLSLLTAAGCGLAVLSKGLIGIVFPGIVLLCWLLITQQWRFLKSWYWVLAAVLFLAITVPWHLLVQLKNPDFFNFYFVQQHFLRYATILASRQEPIYFYLLVLMVGMFPWTLFLAGAIHDACPRWNHRMQQNHYVKTFLLLWIVIIFLFFSFSQSKLMPYILPIFPPIALLLGCYFDREENHKSKFFRLSFKGLVVMGVLVSILFPLTLYHYAVSDHALVTWFAWGMGSVCLLSIFLSFLLFERCPFRYVFMTVVMGMALTLIPVLLLMPIADYHSIKPLAVEIQQHRKSHDIIVSYHYYYQDLPYYVGAPVTVVNDVGELLFGVEHGPHDWMVTDKEFWKLFRGQNRMWVISSLDRFPEKKFKELGLKVYVLGRTSTNLLWSNREEW